MAFYTGYRIRKLELDGILDFLYSPEDHDLPPGLTPEQIRKYPAEYYEFKQTKHRHTPKGELKPNPHILLQILKEVGGKREKCAYIGDNLVKDVAMAKNAGVTSVYALYGKAHERPEYGLLKAVTHWPSTLVELERKTKAPAVQPEITLDKNFSQILDALSFETAP